MFLRNIQLLSSFGFQLSLKALVAYMGISICWIVFAFYVESPIACILPFIPPCFVLISKYPQLLLFTLWLVIPFSFDIPITSSVNISLSEPILLCLMAVVIVILISKKDIQLSHWLIGILALQWLWQIALIPMSLQPLLSLKYVLAKTWFYAGFLIFPILYIKSLKQSKLLLEVIHYSLLAITLLSIVRHGLLGFGFETINEALRPFFRNHVIYAALLSLFFPYTIFLYKSYSAFSVKKVAMGAAICIYIFAIIFSYTRTAWIALPLGLGAIVLLRWRFLKLSILTGLLILIGTGYYLIKENNYLNYAPQYEKTVFNGTDIEKHLEATYKLQDVSGMERIYRWIAAKNMIAKRPIAGFGTNTFYPAYKSYTVSSFRTYVSNNPEHSTTHNYFLMTLAEQGIIGCLLFIAGLGFALFRGISLCQKSETHLHKTFISVSIASLIIFILNLFLSDLVEVDRTGGLYFLALAFIIIFDKQVKTEALS